MGEQNTTPTENQLLPEELVNLQRYLPAPLYEALAAESSDPPTRLRSQVITHLSALVEATMSHLPESLGKQVLEHPVVGQADGRFIQGALLFADISGFTAMSERLSRVGREGAEEVTAVVNRYFDVMLAILREYRGELIRFGGDALLGLFTEGHGRYSSATQAVQAAMKMQAAMSQFSETKTSQGTFPLRMSVGARAGQFFAAQLGTAEAMEYALFGGDVNATAAVESAANAGQVLVDQGTYDAIDAELLCTAVPVPGYPDYLAVEYIDLPPLPPPIVPMETHFPLPPNLQRLRRLLRQLDMLTPYLPVGMLARLASDPRAPSLKGEHRLVANLFANVDGLGEIADRLGPGREADIVAALNLYFTHMSQALRQFGGVVNKIDLYDHGDKLMVIFGAPIAHEDDAERAVRAALAMQTAFADVAVVLPEQVGLPDLMLQQRIGISYGYVFAGYVGSYWRHEYTVMGDEVNLAARLMSAAASGQVYVSEHVQRRVQDVALVEPRGAVGLKGKSRPVPIFTIEGLRDTPMPERRGLQSPLVGRQQEWAQLMADLATLQEGRHGRIISIIGEAGVGKSRLVQEWQQTTQAEGQVRWMTARCLSYTESVGYAPFQELLYQLFDLTANESADRMRQQLRRSLAAWFPVDDAEAALPYLANFLNIPLDEAAHERIRYLDGEALQRRTFVALRTVLTAVAQQQPLLILFDAMHWMDRASLDLVEYLMPLVQQLPLGFVWLFRPDREKGCWQLRRKARQEYPHHYREIGLYGLNTADTQQMLLNLIPVSQWPPGVADMILNRVEGNPLYLEEVIRSLINDGLLAQTADGRWQFSETITSITVPDTLEGVLLARLDRLEELCRWTVQMAAVVGRSFPFDVVEHTANELNHMAVTSYLDELQLVEIVREAQRSPELVYAFIHSLMQEVSYSSLAASARREYHRLIARYLEDGRSQGWSRSESLPALVAHHAYEGEDWPRALKYQMQAGQQAQTLFANQEAIDHYRKALHAAAMLPAQETSAILLAIHLVLGQLFIDTGAYDDAAGHLAQAHQLARVRSDEATLVAICRWYARLYEARGDYPQAFTWINAGLAIHSQLHTAENAQIRLLAGLIYIRQGNYEAALEQCHHVLQIGEQLGEVTVLARAHNLLGITYLRSDSNQAIENFHKAFALYQQAGHIQGQATSHNLIANACFNLGRWPEAEYHYLQAHHMFDQIGDKYNRAIADNNLGGIALNRGNIQNALLFYEEGLHLATQIGGSGWMVGTFHMNLGAAYVRQGNAAQARHHLQLGQAFFEQAQSRDFLPEIMRHQAEASLVAGELVLAQEQVAASLTLARELDMLAEEGMSLRVSGHVAYEQARLTEAARDLQQSVTILAEVADEYELARSQYRLAVVMRASGNLQEIRPLLAQAAATFARLEAARDLTAVQEFEKRLRDA
ncbi:MAG: AAA family ATPase [Anaerolineae bacterium]|nr:AAA family ATPase [Anaerolineae bacterium]